MALTSQDPLPLVVLFDEPTDRAGAREAPLLGKLVESFGDVWREAEQDLDGVALRIGDVLSGLFLRLIHRPILRGPAGRGG